MYLKLTLTDGDATYVNFENVIHFSQCASGDLAGKGTEIAFNDNTYITVKQKAEFIFKKLGAPQ